MKLYFSPLACSMATRIALQEAGLDAELIQIDRQTRRAPDGVDLHDLNPLGFVPVLQLDDGQVLTENAAILQLVAERSRHAQLAPRDPLGRARLHQWLSFIGTELHKAVFTPLLDKKADEGARRYALASAAPRLALLEQHLARHQLLLDQFTVADAYLFTILNWTQAVPVSLTPWPAITAYLARLRQRDSVARAVAIETELYLADRGRQAPAPAPPSTQAVIDRFNDVFQRHDPGALDQLVAADCVVENTHPAPDGARFTGRAECVALWTRIATDPAIAFDLEEVLVAGDRATIFWRLRARGAGEVRGVNLMRVRDGQIIEARGYVKGT